VRQLPDIPKHTRIGPYEVGAELGRGGVAVVYKATNTTAPEQGPLAIKVAFRNNENRDRRFVREFERLRVIALPGVVRVYDAGTTEQLIWYVMDQIEGQPMSRAMAAAPSVEEKIAIVLEAGARMFDVLAGIHRLGFIHRDIKPSNILIGRNNETHVLDFGLVRLQERGDTLTRAGRLVGTVAFMSPEQTTGLPLTSRTDIFSAGLVLYEGLVGPRPHKQEEWLGRMCLQQVTPMAIRNPRIPRSLSTAIDRLLTIDPHARPTASEAATMLRDVAAGRLRADWPSPPRFVGREHEVDTCSTAFDNDAKRLIIIEGNVGTGRRRLVEQVQRRALLYGTPRVTGICRPHILGGAVEQVLSELFGTHADPEWRVQTAGSDVGPLLSMWPTLPLPAPPATEDVYTVNEVAKAAANTIHRGTESVGLMVVFQRLDQVDSLTARVIQMLLLDIPARLAIYATMEPRWASARAKKLVDHLVFTDQGKRVTLPDLSSTEASELAASLNDDSPMDGISGGTPQMALEQGLMRLAARRGEERPSFPEKMAVVGLSTFPLTDNVLQLLRIDPHVNVKSGVLREVSEQKYALADNWLRQRAQSLISNRRGAEDALADALTRAGVGTSRWSNVARHMMHGRDPHRALAPAIRAAVHAAETGRFNESRSWLMAIDPMKRDHKDPTYRALRFELSWARAKTSLATDLSRLRTDLVQQTRARAKNEADHRRCDLIEAELLVRQGRDDAAIEHLIASTKDSTTNHHAHCHLKVARIHLDRGDPSAARNHTGETTSLGKSPQRALLGIDLALSEGRANVAIKGCRQAIARATGAHHDPIRGTFLLRLGVALLEQGDRMGSTQAIHEARDFLVRHGHRSRLAEAHLYEAILALGRGHPRAARVRVDPLITTARAFSSDRLLSLGWSMKLRIASIMNDKAAARLAMAGRSTSRLPEEDRWRMAQARWYRAQRDLPQAIHVSDTTRTHTPGSVSLALECASGLIATGHMDRAKHHLQFAQEVSQKRGYRELLTLTQLLRGGTLTGDSKEWFEAIHQARSSPWVELSMTALAMEGRRLILEGDKQAARQKFQNLLERADHIEHHYHRVIANEALVIL
jgi:serine/threonine-protein kinase